MRRFSLLLLLASLACGREDVSEAPSALQTPPRAEGEALTRLDEGRAIHVRVQAAPEGADPDRVVSLRVDGFPELDGTDALDATYVGEGVAVLGVDHRLRYLASPGAEPVELDAQVEPPLSSQGTHLVYARGEMPFFAIVKAEPSTGALEALTEPTRSCWSPAVAATGEVAYVCTAEGRPRLFVHDGQERALPTERFPTSALAPHFDGRRLAFTDETGAVVLDVRDGSAITVDEDAGAIFGDATGLVVTGIDGALRPLEVTP
ncbi:MAG: hypothetical protein H6724_14940 [Sandaracinus sp.]|nr:hypothetical protein [Sandaracinus sp.]